VSADLHARTVGSSNQNRFSFRVTFWHEGIGIHFQLKIAGRSKDMPLRVIAQGVGESWINMKSALVAHPSYQQEGTSRDSQHYERPEMMIVRMLA
jgi:hypothetical protein